MLKIKYIHKPTKNFDNAPLKPEWLIIHCIGFEEEKALKILTGEDDHSVVSAHYFVPQIKNFSLNNSGEYPIFKLLSEDKQARHAGVSKWLDLENFNARALSIEFSSPNYAYAKQKNQDQFNWYHFENYSSQQIEAGILLIKEILRRHQIKPANILTHADISPWRIMNGEIQVGKTDPGSLFPVELLAQHGIGIWPRFKRSRSGPLDTSIFNTQQLLRLVGYHLEQNGDLDLKTLACIRAFKIHYLPEDYADDVVNPVITEKMIIGLENLIDKEYKY